MMVLLPSSKLAWRMPAISFPPAHAVLGGRGGRREIMISWISGGRLEKEGENAARIFFKKRIPRKGFLLSLLFFPPQFEMYFCSELEGGIFSSLEERRGRQRRKRRGGKGKEKEGGEGARGGGCQLGGTNFFCYSAAGRSGAARKGEHGRSLIQGGRELFPPPRSPPPPFSRFLFHPSLLSPFEGRRGQ